ncbi:MAG: Ig domain-containing protein [Clostridiales bacterium]|nr:Ig domain-containing protein [Clostridiales bacterium]
MNKLRNITKLIICLLFVTGVFYHTKGSEKVLAAEGDIKYYLTIEDSGTSTAVGAEYNLEEPSVTMGVRSFDDRELATGVDILWETSSTNVIEISGSPSKTVTLNRKAPGYSMIQVTIMNGDEIIETISCLVKVDFLIDYSAMHLPELGFIEMDLNTLPTTQILFKYVNGDKISSGDPIYNNLIQWESNHTEVATVVDGKLTALGAGNASIIITTNKGATENGFISKTLNVYVKPDFLMVYDNTIVSSSVKGNTLPDSPVENVPTEFTIRSNATPAENLTWVIKETYSGRKIAPTGSGKMEYLVSPSGKSVTFTDVKAGTYDIFAYTDGENNSAGATYAFMRIVVPIKFFGDINNILMSVDDTYNIIENSNIPTVALIDRCLMEPADVVTYHQSTGTLEAEMKGATTVTIKFAALPRIFKNTPDNISLNIKVIDAITLSMSEATLYTNGKLQLYATVTNPDLIVNWSSSKPQVATVDENGMVTAVGVGQANIVASVNDHGIIKSVICKITVKQAVSEITIEPSNITISRDEIKELTAVIRPANAEDVDLVWKSSDESKVVIDSPRSSSTYIIGKNSGNAVITAIDQSNVIVGYCHVTVREPVQRIELSETELTVGLNTGYLQLKATVYPDTATEKGVTWSTSDPAVATVNQYGEITIKGAGKVAIIATSVDNPTIEAICNITVDTPVMMLELDKTELTMKVGQTETLSYTLLPVDATNKAVLWMSSNPSVAEVNANGKVTAKAKGTAIIILRSPENGLTAYCTVKVNQTSSASEANFKFDKNELTLMTGDEYELKVTFEDSGMDVTDLIWRSSDTKLAKVDRYGKITALEGGVVTIYATNDEDETVKCKVTIIKPVESILLNFSKKSIQIGDKFNLIGTVIPSDATNTKITWKSENTEIATVSKNGLVEGLKGGIVKITATVEGEGVSASCVVTVHDDATGISLNHESYTLGLGEKLNLKATVFPEYANQNVKWVSSNEDVATVNAKGRVVGVSYGFATITAITMDGAQLEASCEIEVLKPVTRVTLNKGNLFMMVGESEKLIATVQPKNATYNKVKWTSSNDDIAMVDENGKVIALAAGKVTITASAQDGSGKKSVCMVTVRAGIPTTSITVAEKKVVMVPGETKNVKAVLNPTNSTDGITWSSDNSAVAKVDSKTGKITARATGTANITVMSDSGKTAVIQVNVIGLNMTELTLEQYTTSYNNLTVEGTNSTVNWSIDNQQIAETRRVGNNSLRISARAIGKATITATVDGRKLRCRLTVTSIR